MVTFLIFLLNLQYKMFLLNINGCNAPSTLDVFTIQNVPIKWDTGKYKGLGADNLQYKMFLLNGFG